MEVKRRVEPLRHFQSTFQLIDLDPTIEEQALAIPAVDELVTWIKYFKFWKERPVQLPSYVVNYSPSGFAYVLYGIDWDSQQHLTLFLKEVTKNDFKQPAAMAIAYGSEEYSYSQLTYDLETMVQALHPGGQIFLRSPADWSNQILVKMNSCHLNDITSTLLSPGFHGLRGHKTGKLPTFDQNNFD